MEKAATSYYVIAVPHFHTAAGCRPNWGTLVSVPRATPRLPCLQNKVYELAYSPPIGDVPASDQPWESSTIEKSSLARQKIM
jgi:hypothetical protein